MSVETEVFNNPETFVEGWYWALRSDELPEGKTRAVSFLRHVGNQEAARRGFSGPEIRETTHA